MANNSHILCRTFKNLISMRSVNCDEFHGHAPFRPLFFFLLAKCRKPTFSEERRGEERRGEAHCMRLNSQTVRQAFYTDMHLLQHMLQEHDKKKHPYQTVPGVRNPQPNPVKYSVMKRNKGAHTYIFFPPACERMRVHGSPIPKPSKPRPFPCDFLMPRLY